MEIRTSLIEKHHLQTSKSKQNIFLFQKLNIITYWYTYIINNKDNFVLISTTEINALKDSVRWNHNLKSIYFFCELYLRNYKECRQT